MLNTLPTTVGFAQFLLAAVTHPNEAKAMVNYSIWRDPLHNIQDNKESGWYVQHSPGLLKSPK